MIKENKLFLIYKNRVLFKLLNKFYTEKGSLNEGVVCSIQ